MLIYFRVGNYKSINEPISINFNASTVSEHFESNVLSENKTALLKTILLYGHNASGKSKILDAFAFFKWFVNNSATEKQARELIDVNRFELSDITEDKPSFFEIAFILKNKKYRYGFEADENIIQREWLLETVNKKEYPVFLRIKSEFQIDHTRFDNANDLEKRTRKNALFLSVASQWNVSKAEDINEWFNSLLFVHGLREDSYRELTIEAIKDKKLSIFVNAFIKSADLGIDSVEAMPLKFVDKVVESAPEHIRKNFSSRIKDPTENHLILSMHTKFDKKGIEVSSIPFDFDLMESDGTIKLFNIAGVIIKAIIEDKIVIIDEFDARLHTLLTRAIIKLFNSSKIKSKAQLLASCHDTALLDNDLLRRDQIYFVEKDNTGATKLTSLAEYKSNDQSPIDKNYLAGKFGAIPFIINIEDLLSDVKKNN